MENKILRINSKYNKKLLFSYLKYNYILKLIKYNKSCQNELDITKQNYEDINHYSYYEKKNEEDRLSYKAMDMIKEEYHIFLYYLVYFLAFIINYFINYIFDCIFKKGIIQKIINGIYYLILDKVLKIIINLKNKLRIKFDAEKIVYLLIYFVINLIFIKVLLIVIDKNEFIDISDETKLNLIPKIYKSFILYSVFIALIIRFIYKPKYTKYFLMLCLLFFFIINGIYEYLIILKIQILKKLDKNNLSYHDYFILFINNFILVYHFFFIIISFFLFFPKIIIKQYLTEYKNIKINEYLLPDNFKKIKYKNKYLKEIAHNFKHVITIEEKEIIASINKYRVENKGKELILIDNDLPEFIINDEISEIYLSIYKTLFKLRNEKYLFKYKTGEFQKDLLKNKDILLKQNLNRINVIQQNSNVYILLFEDDKKNSK